MQADEVQQGRVRRALEALETYTSRFRYPRTMDKG